MVVISNLTAGYDHIPIIKNINMNIKRGEIVGLLGANGSGKTTTILSILGFTQIIDGEITVDDINVKRNIKTIRKKVSMLMQVPDNQLFARSVYEELAIAPYKRGLSHEEVATVVENILKDLNMGHLKDVPPHKLSFGQKKKLAMGVLLSIDPDYYLLDEPMAGLDYEGRMFMEKTICHLKNQNKGILLISHDLLSLTLCDRIYILKDGSIVKEADKQHIRDLVPNLHKWGLYLPTLE